MPKRTLKIEPIPDDPYSPNIRFCLDTRYEKQLGDMVYIYGNKPVMERDGHIVAVLGEHGFERPLMVCEIPHDENGKVGR